MISTPWNSVAEEQHADQSGRWCSVVGAVLMDTQRGGQTTARIIVASPRRTVTQFRLEVEQIRETGYPGLGMRRVLMRRFSRNEERPRFRIPFSVVVRDDLHELTGDVETCRPCPARGCRSDW